MKIDKIEFSGRNLLGGRCAIHIGMQVFSDLISPEKKGLPDGLPEPVVLQDVKGVLGIAHQNGGVRNVLATITPDYTALGWSSSSNELTSYMTKVDSVARATNESWSNLNLITSPLSHGQVEAIDSNRFQDNILLFILIEFSVKFVGDRNGTIYTNKLLLRDNYRNNTNIYSLGTYEWARVKSQMGFNDTFYLEIPNISSSINDVMNYIAEAEKALDSWNVKGVFDNCREAGVLLDKEVLNKHKKKSFVYSEKWKRSYDNFSSFSSLALHVEDLKKGNSYSPDEVKIGRIEAEHLILLTKSLASYAGRLISENSGTD